MTNQPKLMILDGNSLVYRAFYAIPLLRTSEGLFTNAAYGFTNMLLKILQDEQPECVAVAFDKGRVTFRNEDFADYKGHRKPTPDELRPQFPMVKDILRAMQIPVYELEGFEGDDLIGTVTRQAEEEGFFSLIVTGDRDALQLVSARTGVMLTKKGITELDFYDPDRVRERYGLEPRQMIELKGLMGDASDNIPGVPGVGEKTALKLVQQYGSIENLYENLADLPPKLREKLETNRDQAFLSRKLATIIRDVDYDIHLDHCHLGDPDYDTLLSLFRKLEFKGLVKAFSEKQAAAGGPKTAVLEKAVSPGEGRQANPQTGQPEPFNQSGYSRLSFAEALHVLPEDLAQPTVGLDYELSNADPMLAELVGLSWSPGGGVARYTTSVPEGQTALFQEEPEGEPESLARLAGLIGAREGLQIICRDGKKLLVALDRYGIRWNEIAGDVVLAAYLLNPGKGSQDLAALAEEYLGQRLPTAEDGAVQACARAEAIVNLHEILTRRLAEDELDKLYYQVELPLIRILADMEITGVRLDPDRLREMSGELAGKLAGLTKEVYRLAGEEFNINSPKQLGYILFDKLNLPALKKTKTGYSTDVEVLENLADEHRIAATILEYRMLAKLKSTYVDGLIGLINPRTGRVHTSFNQAVTATGRLSSTEPNLQNIPIRVEEGRRIRKVFLPAEPTHWLVAADYSQIELRVLAHISGDESFIRAFREGQDIHAHTASEVFGVPMAEVTKEMRSSAKAVNFGIVYGISDFGLARNTGVSRKEAKAYIEGYFARYPGIKRFMETIVVTARKQGYVTTLLDRRRYIPDILSSNRNVRAFGERTAFNTPIQGSAADIIKLAMVRVAESLKSHGLQTKMILQVHDELIFDVPPDELDRIVPLVRECMEGAVELDVPLIVDMKKGRDWYDMEAIPRQTGE